MLIKSFACGVLVLTSLTAIAQDAPDTQKESTFHEIYKKYNEQPTSQESWESAIGDRQSQVYRVQKGDTLSDISRTLFGDQFYWPKIWSLNTGSIANPHEIDPTMNIQFFPGSVADAPTLDLVDAREMEESVVKNPPPPEPPEKSPSDRGLIPKPKRNYARPLKQLPPSLPLQRYGALPKTKPSIQIDLVPRKYPTSPEYLAYAVMDQAPAGEGKIVDTEMGMKTAAEFQYVIVHIDNENQKNFIVYSVMSPVKDPTREDGKASAPLIEYQGEIEILNKVNPEENLYRAIVKKAIEPIEVGSLLLPGKLPTFDPAAVEAAPAPRSTIIGGQYESKRNLLNTRALIFLSSGSDQGLREGQSIGIYENIRKRLPKTKVLMNERQIGVAKIIRVSKNYSTAYVTRADDDISVGDYAGSSQVALAPPTGPALDLDDDAPSLETSKASPDEFDELMKENTDATAIPEMDSEDPSGAPAEHSATPSTNDSDFDF